MDTMGDDVLGDEDVEGDFSVVGASVMRGGRAMLALPRKPAWRRNMITPGVFGPQQGLQPLPLVASLNGGTFTAAFPAIEFAARPQKPFRPERLLASVTKTAGAGGVRILCNLFVGAGLQQAQRGLLDLELLGATNAFGVRLALQAATAALDIALPMTVSIAVPAGESVFVSVMFLGRSLG
jgi:hypothetical protein